MTREARPSRPMRSAQDVPIEIQADLRPANSESPVNKIVQREANEDRVTVIAVQRASLIELKQTKKRNDIWKLNS